MMEENNLIGHLSELRNRLIKALIFCLVLLVFMFPFADDIYVLNTIDKAEEITSINLQEFLNDLNNLSSNFKTLRIEK